MLCTLNCQGRFSADQSRTKDIENGAGKSFKGNLSPETSEALIYLSLTAFLCLLYTPFFFKFLQARTYKKPSSLSYSRQKINRLTSSGGTVFLLFGGILVGVPFPTFLLTIKVRSSTISTSKYLDYLILYW